MVNFRTPVDINTDTSKYEFPESTIAAEFSGVFRVIQIESSFVQGVFNQTLSLLRMPGQIGTPTSSKVQLAQDPQTVTEAITTTQMAEIGRSILDGLPAIPTINLALPAIPTIPSIPSIASISSAASNAVSSVVRMPNSLF